MAAAPTATVYFSTRCPNCERFLDGVRRSSSARASARLVDIDQTPVRGVQYVPTVVLPTGQVHVGTKAFEWLRGHESDAEFEPYSSARGLAFSHVTTSGGITYSEPFSQFVPPDA
jgi:hypothetical protein